MSLFTDRTISTTEDLRVYESSILDIANTEGIELEAKLRLAQREIGVELSAILLRQPQTADLSRDLRNVVVTEPLSQWHALHSLAVIYRDAYNNQLNERYLGKWKEYSRQSSRAGTLCLEAGVGVVMRPLDQAQAPSCNALPGGTLLQRTYYVQVAWVNAAGQTGAASEPVVLEVAAANLLTVQAVATPAEAAGWYLYVGVSGDSMLRQNVTPLYPGTVWIESIAGTSGVNSQKPGQKPDFYVTRQQRLRRG